MNFAKLFNDEKIGQILVTTESENGPALKFRVNHEGMNIASSVNLNDDDTGLGSTAVILGEDDNPDGGCDSLRANEDYIIGVIQMLLYQQFKEAQKLSHSKIEERINTMKDILAKGDPDLSVGSQMATFQRKYPKTMLIGRYDDIIAGDADPAFVPYPFNTKGIKPSDALKFVSHD